MAELADALSTRLANTRNRQKTAATADVLADLAPLQPFLKERGLEIVVYHHHDSIYLQFEDLSNRTASAVSIAFEGPRGGKVRKAAWRNAVVQTELATAVEVGDNGLISYLDMGFFNYLSVDKQPIDKLVGDLRQYIETSHMLLGNTDYPDVRYCGDREFADAYKLLRSAVDEGGGGTVIAVPEIVGDHLKYSYDITASDGTQFRLRYDRDVALEVNGQVVDRSSDCPDHVLALFERHYGTKRALAT